MKASHRLITFWIDYEPRTATVIETRNPNICSIFVDNLLHEERIAGTCISEEIESGAL